MYIIFHYIPYVEVIPGTENPTMALTSQGASIKEARRVAKDIGGADKQRFSLLPVWIPRNTCRLMPYPF